MGWATGLVCLTFSAMWCISNVHCHSMIDPDVLVRLQWLEDQVSRQQNKLGVQGKQLDRLEARVTEQDKTICKQTTTINHQQKVIADQQKALLGQEHELGKQRSKSDEQSRRLASLEEIFAVAAGSQDENTAVIGDVQDKTGEQKEEHGKEREVVHAGTNETGDVQKSLQHRTANIIPQLSRRLLLGDDGPVAFHAVNTKNENAHIGNAQNIIFNKVWLDMGSGFHDQQGVFIAPVAGLYIFSTSITSYTNSYPLINVSVIKNGVVLARALGHGTTSHDDQGSVTLVTQLAVNDEVWVSHHATIDTSYWGDYYTSFMGCLLWAV